MPENISMQPKYNVNLPYPEVKVEGPNVEYANLLLKDYAGAFSELTAITLYVYQHIMGKGSFDDYAQLVNGVAMSEMKHLELLGKSIKLLGVKPIYFNNVWPPGQLWSSSYVNYSTNIVDMLLIDIETEKKAIENFRHHMMMIKDRFIKELLERIILDEELHVKLFNQMLDKYR